MIMLNVLALWRQNVLIAVLNICLGAFTYNCTLYAYYSQILTSEWSGVRRVYLVAREVEIRMKYRYLVPVITPLPLSQNNCNTLVCLARAAGSIRLVFDRSEVEIELKLFLKAHSW